MKLTAHFQRIHANESVELSFSYRVRVDSNCFIFWRFRVQILGFTPCFRVIKSRSMRLTGHVAGVGERRAACRILVGKLKETDHTEDIDVDGTIILK